MIKRYYCIALFFMIIHATYAQNYINYNENNGLPSNHIYRITQDVNGFIWIGTNKGLVKYDGKKFKTFTVADGLQSNAVWNMFPTSDGKLWFASKTSKIGYIEKDSVHIFSSNVKDNVFNPIYTGVLKDRIFPNGSINSFTFDTKTKSWKLSNNYRKDFNTIYIKHKNWNLFGMKRTNLKTLFLINSQKKDTVKLQVKIPLNIPFKQQITDSLFFVSNLKKYMFINLNTLKIHEKDFKEETGIEFNRNICINYVNDEIQISGNKFVGKLNKNYGLSDIAYIDKDINSNNIFIDKQNTLWVATFSNGVYKLPYAARKVTIYFPKKEVSKLRKVNDKIVALVQKEGFYNYNEQKKEFRPFLKHSSRLYNCGFIPSLKMSYYVGVKMSAITDEKRKLKILKYQERFPDYLRSMVYLNNSFYSHSGFGAYKIAITDSIHMIKYYRHIGTNHIIKFNNRILVATNSGLKQIENNTLSTAKINYTKKVTRLFILSENQLLMITDGDGAFITDLTSMRQIPETRSLIVSDAYKDGNTLWLATNKGVQEYHIKDNKYSLIRTIDKRYGLPTDKINSVITTKERILIATNLGVVDLPLKHLSALEPLDIYIKNIFFNQQKLINNSTVLYKEDSFLEAELGIIDFSENTKPIEYAYRLEPIHKTWHTTTSSKLNFNNLLPNNYRLLIKVKNLRKSTSFTIKPQWYQMRLFRILGAIALILLIVFITVYIIWLTQRRKNRKLLQLKKVSELELKALRSQMNPHFVFNSLTAIQYFISQNDLISSDKYLVRFSKLIRDFFELSRKQTISIQKEKELLDNYLELEKMRFKGKLSYKIKIHPELNVKTKIPTMLLQPVVENAINHGIFKKRGNGFVEVSFKKINKKTFSVSVSDDGVGISITGKDEQRFKSTSVLADRIQFLNDTGKWHIKIRREDLYKDRKDKGHIVSFTITQMNTMKQTLRNLNR